MQGALIGFYGISSLVLSSLTFLPINERIARLYYTIADWRKSNFEVLMDSEERHKIKKKIAKKYGVKPRHVKFKKEDIKRGRYSTTTKGGYIVTIDVHNKKTKEKITTLYHKVDPYTSEEVPSRERWIYEHAKLGLKYVLKHNTSGRNIWNSEDLAKFVQLYFTKYVEKPVDFIKEPLSASAIAENITEESDGKVLEEVLDKIGIDEKRAVFFDIVNKLYELNEKAENGFIRELQHQRKASGSIEDKTLEMTVRKIGEKAKDELRRILYMNELIHNNELCHLDLNQGNIMIQGTDVKSILDWSNVNIGELYFDVYSLQRNLGLIGDRESNAFVDKKLEEKLEREKEFLRTPKTVDEYKARTRAKWHLMIAMKVEGYRERTLKEESLETLTELRNYHFLEMLTELEKYQKITDDEVSRAIDFVNIYMEKEGINKNRYFELREKYGNDFEHSKTLMSSYDSTPEKVIEAVKRHQKKYRDVKANNLSFNAEGWCAANAANAMACGAVAAFHYLVGPIPVESIAELGNIMLSLVGLAALGHYVVDACTKGTFDYVERKLKVMKYGINLRGLFS